MFKISLVACAILLQFALLVPTSPAATCREGLHQDNFNPDPAVSLVACTDTTKLLGEVQGTRWWIKNNTGDKLNVTFDKLYFFSCNKQETKRANIYLDPYQEINGGYFSGDLDLGDPIFPADVCGSKNSTLTRVGVHHFKVRNMSAEERERVLKQEQEKREKERLEAERTRKEQQEAQRREEQKRRELAEQTARERAEKQAEQKRLQEEREARERERQKEMERQAVKRNLDYIDSITEQQKRDADNSYRSYARDSDKKMQGLKSQMQDVQAEAERDQREAQRNSNRMERTLAKEERELGAADRTKKQKEQELKGAIDSYLDKFK